MIWDMSSSSVVFHFISSHHPLWLAAVHLQLCWHSRHSLWAWMSHSIAYCYPIFRLAVWLIAYCYRATIRVRRYCGLNCRYRICHRHRRRHLLCKSLANKNCPCWSYRNHISASCDDSSLELAFACAKKEEEKEKYEENWVNESKTKTDRTEKTTAATATRKQEHENG